MDRRLTDGDVIDLGGGCELEVVHLPGHSQGSVGFYWRREGILLAGDSLPGVGGNIHGLPILDEPAAYERSLERVQALKECIGKLKENQRQIINLRFHGRAAVNDIAARLKKSAASISMVIMRVKAALAKCMHHQIGEI